MFVYTRTLKGTCQLLLLLLTVQHTSSFKLLTYTAHEASHLALLSLVQVYPVEVEVEGSIQFIHRHSMVNQ